MGYFRFFKFFRLLISCQLISAFVCSTLSIPSSQAGEMVMMRMPIPGSMVHLSPEYIPAHLQGLTIHPENALKFDFLIYRGDGELDLPQKRQEYTKLVKYFLASLTIPDADQWVNLSPYEPDRIIKNDFGKTEMGRDLLSQDYLLKQITSSLMYPETSLGRKFWSRIYARAFKEFGTSNVPVNTFNKVWIIPDEAAVYESGNTVYVLRDHLKVMLEEDYLSLQKHTGISSAPPAQAVIHLPDNAHVLASQIVKQIILPELEIEVNEGKNFAMLRQVYSGMILAAWYKHALKETLLGKVYADKAKVSGVNQKDLRFNENIYKQYLKAFKKGVFNFIKEDQDRYTREIIPRKYFAGGTVGFRAVNFSAAATGFSPGTLEVWGADTSFSQPVLHKIDLAQMAADFGATDKATVALDAENSLGKKSVDMARISDDEDKQASLKDHITLIHQKIKADPEIYKQLIAHLDKSLLGLDKLIQSPGQKPASRTKSVFYQQTDVQAGLAGLYTANGDIAYALQGPGPVEATIHDFFIERIYRMAEEGKLTARQRFTLLNRIKREFVPDTDTGITPYHKKYSIFALLTTWIRKVRAENPDTHFIYLARDAGFIHMIDGVTNPGNSSSVYHLSRTRMSGETGMRVYDLMRDIILQAMVESSGKTYDDFFSNMERLFDEQTAKDPVFAEAVSFTARELRALGYGQGERQNLVLIDTGFLGTVPYFVRNVLIHDAKSKGVSPPNITVAITDPSSIRQFAQQLFGYNPLAFSLREWTVLNKLDALGRNPLKDNVGAELEGIEDHPISFNEHSFRIERSSVEEQVFFEYEQAVAIAAAMEFMKIFSETADDRELQDQLKRYIERNFGELFQEKMNKFADAFPPDSKKDFLAGLSQKPMESVLEKLVNPPKFNVDLQALKLQGNESYKPLKDFHINFEKFHVKSDMVKNNWPAWALAVQLFFAKPDDFKINKPTDNIPAFFDKQNPDSAMITDAFQGQRVQDPTGAYLKSLVGPSSTRMAAPGLNINRRGLLGLVGAMGVTAAVSRPSRVFAQKALPDVDIESLNEFRHFINNIRQSNGFNLPRNGREAAKVLGYKSSKFADLYMTLFDQVNQTAAHQGISNPRDYLNLITQTGDAILKQYLGGALGVNLDIGAMDTVLQSYKERLKSAGNDQELSSTLLHFENYIRIMLDKDRTTVNIFSDAVNDFSAILLSKGYLVKQSPRRMDDEKILVLYKITRKDTFRTSRGDIPVLHVRQVTQYADGRLRGNNGWSNFFTDYVVVFDEAIEKDAKSYSQALEQNHPTFSAPNALSQEGQMINALSRLELDYLQKAFPPGQRSEEYIADVIKKIVAFHEAEHKLRARRAGIKEGDVLHQGDEERVAILSSMFRPQESIFELARMVKLAAFYLDGQSGLIFSWNVLAGLMKVDPKGKTTVSVLQETIQDLKSFKELPNLKDSLRKRALDHFESLTGYKPDTVTTDKAMLGPADEFGGLDLNAAPLNLLIKRDGRGVPLPLLRQDWAQLSQIRGFYPTIIEIKPAGTLPILSELNQKFRSNPSA